MPLRVEFSGAPHHLMAGGKERRTVIARDVDRQLWLSTLAEMVEGFEVVVHCYCIMDNHYHLVIAMPSANLSAAKGWFQTTFTVPIQPPPVPQRASLAVPRRRELAEWKWSKAPSRLLLESKAVLPVRGRGLRACGHLRGTFQELTLSPLRSNRFPASTQQE